MSIKPRMPEDNSPNSDGDSLANFTTKLLENELVFLRDRIFAVFAGSLLSEVAVAYENKDEKTFWATAKAYDTKELVEPLVPLSLDDRARIQELQEAYSIIEAKLASRNSNHRTGVVGELAAEYIFSD